VLYAAADGLLGLLHPVLQAAIAGCLLLVLLLGGYRLLQRGPSRMNTALLITGGLIIALTLLATQLH
jgi:hypothetical protein